MFALVEDDRETSPILFERYQILMKVDYVGAIDYPYDRREIDENIMFVGEKQLVKVIKKTDKSFKTYIKDCELLMKAMDETFGNLNRKP